MTGLNYSNLGMVMLSGDLTPCGWDGVNPGYKCFGETATTVPPLAYNHGYWLSTLWPWFRSQWPTVQASCEVIAGDSNGELIMRTATWVQQRTPTVSYIAVSLYSELTPGASWLDYANRTVLLLNSYHSVATLPLWIDEYGMRICQTGQCAFTEADQTAFYNGFLGASTCWTTRKYPKFAWVGGNDYPYNSQFWCGLASSFSGTTPVWRPAWSAVSVYFNLDKCP